MKKLRKSSLSIVLLIALVVSMATPGFAESVVTDVLPDTVQLEEVQADDSQQEDAFGEALSSEEILSDEIQAEESIEILTEENQTDEIQTIEVSEEETGPVVEVKDAATYLDIAAGIKAGVYGWNLSDDGTYYSLGSVDESGNQIITEVPGMMGNVNKVPLGIFTSTQITNPYNQTMEIYVPAAYLNADGTINYEGNVKGYTAATAPIIFENNNGAWKSGNPKACDTNYIKEGFIYVSCGSRSRDAKDESDQYWTGKAPAMVVDLKAGVISLRANDAVIPGDKDRIISVGTSGAGQMSTILGASGDMPEYYPYLYATGAAGVTLNEDGSYSSQYADSVYGMQAYCPIADLENADLAYAWMRYDAGETGVQPMGGAFHDFTDFEKALQEDEANAFVDYINGLNLTDEDGNALTLENPRKGSYYDAVLANISDAFNAFADNTVFPLTVTVGRGPSAQEVTYADFADYLAKKYGADTSAWLSQDEEGTWQITDLAGFINGTNFKRNKMIPGFDTMNGDAENDAFGPETVGPVHYCALVGKLLQDNYDRYSKLDGFNKEYVDAYIADTITDTEKAELIHYQTNLMNATEILLGADGLNAVNPAPYFRTRNGTADEHTSFTIAYNVCQAAKAAGSDIDYSLVWDMGHGSEEGTTTGTFIDWVKDICPLDTDLATTFSETELTVKVDNKDKKVTEIIDNYVTVPTSIAQQKNTDYGNIDQLLSIYIPENATYDSPIMLYVNNSGWQADAFQQRTKIENGKKYFSNKDTDKIGKALANGYVIVSYGCRSRNDAADENGEFLGHSPATMTDTKAVIRYLRANADKLAAGDPEHIVVTGTSGGGALSVIIAASGNSSEYFESLYEIGAAGMEQTDEGEYISTIRDDVFATIAYCPINDLREADAAYEFTYNTTRAKLLDGTVAGLDGTNAFNQQLGNKPAKDDFAGYNFDSEEALKVSAELAAQYGDYVDGLGLKLDDGTALTKENLKDAIADLLKAEIAEAVDEFGAEQIKADLDADMPAADGAVKMNAKSADWNEWLKITQEEKEVIDRGRPVKRIVTNVDVDSFNYDNYLYYVARNKKLKVPYAFSNVGLGIAQQNEDSLYGARAYKYSPYEFLAWNNDKTRNNGAGLDDTGLTWDEFMKTDAGYELALQLDMSSPIPFLTNQTVAGTEDSYGDSAPYWYVRHGMADRDTSFALQTVLRYALTNDETIRDANFEFAWLKSHSGDYDVNEAYTWLENILKGQTKDAAQQRIEELQRQAEEALAEAEALAEQAKEKDTLLADAKAAAEAAEAKAKEAAEKQAAAEKAAKDAAAKIALKKGAKFVVGNNIYKVTNASKKTASFLGVVAAKKSVSIPATVKAYNGVKYKVTAIGAKAFSNNTTLTKVTIGKNVTNIGASAFAGCKKLKTVAIKATKLKKIGKKAFKGINAKATIKVPKAKKKAYTKLIKKAGMPKKAKVK